MSRDAQGRCTGGVTTADGRHGVLPDEFFTHPNLTVIGGALTGLEQKASQGGIPMMTAASMEDVSKGARYGGMSLAVATALYDTVTAKTWHDACVAAVSGTAGIAGGDATATAAAGLFSEMPAAIPFAAAAGNVAGTWTFGALGTIVGNLVCPR